ncbi:unnamed protein product [Soboliphyme baturini]|uniref:Ovule protein n=1 Tax=Soboliphyme baturini TaxID=241478 RepID=A0A183JAJ8_9BILA|nr:unnamed protein product [Soboliphyme baturini]
MGTGQMKRRSSLRSLQEMTRETASCTVCKYSIGAKECKTDRFCDFNVLIDVFGCMTTNNTLEVIVGNNQLY